MTCPSEFILAQHADGELGVESARGILEHVDGCPNCRNRVDGLMAENRLLVQSLQEAVVDAESEPVDGVAPAAPSLFWLATTVASLALCFRTAFGILFGFEMPEAVAWLDPSRLSGQLNLLAEALTYGARDAAAMAASAVNALGFTVLWAGALVAGLWLLQRRRGAAFVLGGLMLALASPLPGRAIDVRTDATVTVAEGETLDDTLIAFAESITVDGVVTGDLIAGGQVVIVRGVVEGNLVAMGQRLEIAGTVRGTVVGLGQGIDVDGAIDGDLYAAGESLVVGDGGRIGGNVVMAGADASFGGAVGADVHAFAARLDVSGEVGRDLTVYGDRVVIQAPARIGGDLEATVADEDRIQVDPGATVVGETTIELHEEEIGPSRFATVSFYVGQILRLGAAVVAGLCLLWLLPAFKGVRLDAPRDVLTAGGVGFLAVVATPVAALVAAITIIGIPVAIVAIMAWILGLYLSKILVAYFVGRALLKSGDDSLGSTVLALLAGLVLVAVAVNVPLVGGVINVLLVVIGLGALLVTAYRAAVSRREAEAV